MASQQACLLGMNRSYFPSLLSPLHPLLVPAIKGPREKLVVPAASCRHSPSHLPSHAASCSWERITAGRSQPQRRGDPRGARSVLAPAGCNIHGAEWDPVERRERAHLKRFRYLRTHGGLVFLSDINNLRDTAFPLKYAVPLRGNVL